MTVVSVRHVLSALALMASSVAAAAPPVDRREPMQQHTNAERPDFSSVTSRRAVEAFVRDGRLVRVSIFPTELGGPDDPLNYTWLPPAVAYVRTTHILPSLKRLSRKTGATRLNAAPDYRGKSLVPISISYSLSNSDTDPSPLTMILEVW